MKQGWRVEGFSLIEMLVAMAVLAVTVGITFTSLFGVRQKALLQDDVDQVNRLLEFAKQQSIIAYEGESYSFTFSQADNVIKVEPGSTPIQLHNTVSLEITPSTDTISFSKLTGETDQEYTITLSQDQLEGVVVVEPAGIITQQPIMSK